VNRLAVIAGALLATAAPLAAQTGLPPLVLRLAGSTRSAGLNGAAASLMGDAASVFGNPAGLAIIRHIAVEGDYRWTGTGEYVATAAGAWRIRQFDLGGGVQYVGPATLGPRNTEMLGVGSLVYRFGLIAVGGSVKDLRLNTAGVQDRAIGADLGLAIAVFDIMAPAFSVQNVGGNLRDSSGIILPRLSRFGFTMNYVDPQESFRLMSVLEVQWPKGRGSRVVIGGEAGTVIKGVGVVGRLAYGSKWVDYQPAAVTFGGSVVLGRVIADYAFEPTTALPESRHRFGLRLAF